MLKLSFRILVQFSLVFALLAIVPSLYFISELTQAKQSTEQHLDLLAESKLSDTRSALVAQSNNILNSIKRLSNNGLFLRAVAEPSQQHRQALEDSWRLFLETHGDFSQLRLLDAQGQERVRVNHHQGASMVVPPASLQNKRHRDYFKFAQTAQAQSISAFGIDLERENGDIVLPLKPSLRFIVPVDIKTQRMGYFVANLDLNYLYHRLNMKTPETLPDVFNEQGYYVMSNHNERVMGHIVEWNAHHRLDTIYPVLWEKIPLSQKGTLTQQGQRISFDKVTLDMPGITLKLILVTKTTDKQVSKLYLVQRNALLIQALVVALVIFLISLCFVVWNHNHAKNSMDSQIARAAMNGMSAMLITDRHNRIIRTNEEFTRVSGYTFEEVKGKQPSFFAASKHEQEFYINMWKILESDGLWEGEVVNKRRDGSPITEILRVQTVKDISHVIQFYVASFVDISHRKELENRLREMSEKDAMTGLWNRRKFDQKILSYCYKTRHHHISQVTCFAIADVDHFKRINDNLGHDEGDKIIKSVALALAQELRHTDFIARIGGEEFAIIMPYTQLNEAERLSNRLRLSVSLRHNEQVTVSIGVTDMDHSVADTYKRADVALYESKSLGRNRVSLLPCNEMDTVA
ncbi:diguanylate cyclase [Vibrio ostreicida]|uniref:diguanylate cyclase n=1 Tax=Vibrio ostreicida TaxID=526588 RepID=A0ABT8BYE9_9VIBR|nr:diguanylate cyclase [Vibrio ostreicida]MDN3611683.1 diguanylate cyclase [Vibrio ostreicida]NPD10119.1 diguanylate cyclase [Vibrio ostreicida]